MMGHDHPAPNEVGGKRGEAYEYTMKDNEGVTILVSKKRLGTTPSSIQPSSKKWWQFWKSENSTYPSPKTELETIKSLLKRSDGARDFTQKIMDTDGFEIQDEGPMGITVQGRNCKFIFSVLASHGEDNIFSLAYKEGDNPVIALIDEGKRKF